MHPSELEGPMPDRVGQVLHDLAADVPADLAIVEVGSYRGRSTCWLATGAGAEGTTVGFDDADLPGPKRLLAELGLDVSRHARGRLALVRP